MKIFRFFLTGAVAFAAAASLYSCSDKEEIESTPVTGNDDGQYAATASISCSDGAFTANDKGGIVNFPAEGGEVVVSVSCGTAWTVSNNASDLFGTYVDVASGTLTLSASQSTNAVKQYGTVIVMTASERIQFATISLVQDAYVATQISVETDSWSAPASAASTTIGVECDYDWTVESVGAEWLTAEKTDGTTLTLSVVENTDEYSRTARVVLTCTDGVESSSARVEVTQNGAAHVSLTPGSLAVDGWEDDYTVTVASNCDWEVSGGGDWYSVERADDGSFTLHMDENGTGEKREGTVTVTASDGDGGTAQAELAFTQDIKESALVLTYFTGANTAVVLPLTGTVDCTVVWGDGYVDTYDYDYPTHGFVSAGFHTVRVSGTVTALRCDEIASTTKPYSMLATIDQWGLTGLTSMERAFAYASSLTSMPDDTDGSFANVTTFKDAFGDCIVLKEIPAGLLTYAAKATSFYGTFAYMKQITSIPAGLFDNCPNVTSMMFTFQGDSKLETIPEGLFDNCAKVRSCFGLFQECPITSIPDHIFDKMTECTSFKYCFYQTSITSIPDDLFKYNTKVTDFFACFQETPITEIPENLFATCTEVTEFCSVFNYCYYLKKIPENLFANCTKAERFEVSFGTNTSLTEIPENLFANCPNVTNFKGTFQACTGLTTIPEKLFANSPEVTAFTYVFSVCTNLTGIPAGLFDNNRKVTAFSYAFYNCPALTGESPYTVLSDGSKVHLYERANYPDEFATPTVTTLCFTADTGLSDYEDIPSTWL